MRLNRSLLRLAMYILMLVLLAVTLLLLQRVAQSSSSTAAYARNVSEQEGLIVTALVTKQCLLLTLRQCHPPGKNWHRIDKPLRFTQGGRNAALLKREYLFVQKRPLKEVKEGDAVLTVPSSPTSSETLSWKDAPYSAEAPENRYVYNVDVLYGPDAVDPRPNWTLLKEQPLLSSPSGEAEEVPAYLTVRRTDRARSSQAHPQLKVNDKEYSYKVLQVADMHFSTLEGRCRDQAPEITDCKADRRSLKFIESVLDIEDPDLVVMTGDQIFGEDSFDSITTILKVVAPFIERKIPYAIMMGNHDDEGSVSRRELMSFVSSLPYSLSELGPSEIDGVGNYVFQVRDEDGQSIITFYVLDSHKYSPKPKVNPGYDWLKPNQLEWVKNQQQSLKKLNQKHLSMAFFHIPLPEFKNIPNQPIVGNYKEPITAPKYNTGGRDVLTEMGVSVISVGHDHCNDYCVLDSSAIEGKDDKIWLCYGGAVGEGGYGGYGGTTRRLRVYEIKVSEGSIQTWKRLQTAPNEIFDLQTLVSNGKPVSP